MAPFTNIGNGQDLRVHCHVNEARAGDCFVGVKTEANRAVVFFPIGYQLPDADEDLRQDILRLIDILSEFSTHTDGKLSMQKFEAPQSVDFPIIAYMEIINYFMEQNGYYTEKEPEYKKGDRGKIDWPRTLRTRRPLIQSNGTPAYIDYTVRVSSPNDKNLITQIHKHCVYESFNRLGWLFTPYLPEKPLIAKNIPLFLVVVKEKLANTYNDKDKRLFTAMIRMLEHMDEKSEEHQYYFGTENFEYVWEKLIDRVFGIKAKADYFPHTYWTLNSGVRKRYPALQPDTIMLCDNKIYVLDAKYYQYGITGFYKDLPSSSSISKQITYGEYIHSQDRFKEKHGENAAVYNAFIMPFNSTENEFGSDDLFLNIGEATGDWKPEGDGGFEYERVQGILVDIRYLMQHYSVGRATSQIQRLAHAIESAFEATR